MSDITATDAIPVPVPEPERPRVPTLWCAVEWDGTNAEGNVDADEESQRRYATAVLENFPETSSRLHRLLGDDEAADLARNKAAMRERIVTICGVLRETLARCDVSHSYVDILESDLLRDWFPESEA